ncbi:hypothetical protein Tco_0955930 [Tanacetum coccineum]|uniref:Uncharacterized protein n=1 Tax=Tanacetum coccineum TaxID=301880 RepID=A0ABQ5E8L2_9ASTR
MFGKKTLASTRKGKVLLDDFDDVANGKGKVILDEFEDVGNAKGKEGFKHYVVGRAYCIGARRNLISILPKITSCLEKTSTSTSKDKVVLDDFEDVANGKGKVVLDDFADVGNGKGKVVLDESKDGLV